jgi:hypothetical protein
MLVAIYSGYLFYRAGCDVPNVEITASGTEEDAGVVG